MGIWFKRGTFKFFVIEKFKISLFQPSVDDSQNGRNNVVTVKKSDFEVMEALTSDSIITNSQGSDLNKQQCKFSKF
jgi:hypothetical protein